MSKGRVIVVGSTNTDLVVHCGKLPKGGETVLGGDLKTFAGGKGANQAVAAARAGARVRFIGAFGDDAFGRARRADLEREGVDCSGCVVKKGVPSGVALIAIGAGAKREQAENLIVVAPGANARLTAGDVQRGMGRPGFHDALLLSLEVPMRAVMAALRQGGCGNIIVNPAPMPPNGLPRQLFDLCHFLTPNESEFEAISGHPVGSRPARKALAAFVGRKNKCYPMYLVTRGSRGVDFYSVATKKGYEYRKGKAVPPRVKVRDTVGAGDCFNGCLAAQLARDDLNLDYAIGFAVAASALKVTRQGAQAGMPRRKEILQIFKRVQPKWLHLP